MKKKADILAELKKQAHLLFESKELRAIYLPTEAVTLSSGNKLFKGWKVQWEVSQKDLLGGTAWIELEDDISSDLFDLDLVNLHTLEQWERVREMASTIVERLKEE